MQGYPNLDDHEKAIASTAHVGCRHSKIPAVSKLDIATAMELGMICHICPIPSLETLPKTQNVWRPLSNWTPFGIQTWQLDAGVCMDGEAWISDLGPARSGA